MRIVKIVAIDVLQICLKITSSDDSSSNLRLEVMLASLEGGDQVL